MSASLAPSQQYHTVHTRVCSHAGGTSRHLAALAHAFQFAAASRLGLADHVVVVEGLAASANEERRTQQRAGTAANLLDLGNVIGQRRQVDKVLVVESGDERAA